MSDTEDEMVGNGILRRGVLFQLLLELGHMLDEMLITPVFVFGAHTSSRCLSM
jgi:hypothetical protein